MAQPDHAGADLVPRAVVPVDRSLFLRPGDSSLDLHHRHCLPRSGAACSAGWLCPFGRSEALYKIGGKLRLEALAGFAAAALARPPQVAQVRDLLRPAGGVDVLDGDRRDARRGGALQDHLPGRHHQPRALRPFVPCCWHLAVHRAAYCASTSAPLGAALAMPSTFRWFGLKRKQDCNSCAACAKGCGSLGHRRRRPYRPPRVPALPGLHGALHRRQRLPPLAKSAAATTAC